MRGAHLSKGAFEGKDQEVARVRALSSHWAYTGIR